MKGMYVDASYGPSPIIGKVLDTIFVGEGRQEYLLKVIKGFDQLIVLVPPEAIRNVSKSLKRISRDFPA